MIRLTVRQMEYFEALAETLHFGRAAALVGVTQPALSSQIAEMEERLGRRLFDRGGRIVQLTEDARALRPRIERILSELREVEAGGGNGRAPMEGRFRLGVIPTVAPYLLPSLLPEIRRRFPALVLELRETITSTLIEETIAGRLDGMVAALPLDSHGLTVEELFEDRFFLAVPAADPDFVSPPVPPESPALERLMLLEEGHCMRDQALAVCGKVRPTAMTNYGATSLTTLLQMVAHGQGVTLIPEMATGTPMLDLKVVPFAEPMPSRTIGFAWRRNSSRQGECLALAGVVRQLAPISSDLEEVHGQKDPHHTENEGAEREGKLAVENPV
ncbi:hydrogen peroxide-inducible genes activator [Aquamicrobium sp. LC103]|uniref:hydrogen peroxide-inducible genes activator n=1 Tax=Aquamicrobium sp. LC103 TaxID=1120658 RepID=UPI0009E58A96|nr:hydrogen peroxide-inducible genes activator [Aquamicrobium sp. LC103]TKT80978.1 hydrogen peroxide-inducible genes activator [Aquamicrobium sp. LC103]